MANPIFEDYYNLYQQKRPFKITSQFMLNRLLSMSAKTFMLSNVLNKYSGKISDDHFFTICKNYITGDHAPYVRFISMASKKDEVVEKICGVFNCNPVHGNQIVKIFEKMGYKAEDFFGLNKSKGKKK